MPTGKAIVHWIGCINAIKCQNRLFYDPSLTPTGGRGENLTCFLDSPHMVSYYLPIHFMALNVILTNIIGFSHEF